MPENWQRHLDRWTAASLIDADAASRIRAFEAAQSRGGGLRWPTLLAVAFGVIMLGAGVLLFVSAHWDELAPSGRMALVVLLVAMFHVAGAWTTARFENMAIALHAVGTIALGAGIALTGQIFHLDTHWPAGIMLWAFGALLGWLILRHWTQAAIAALLIPYWLCGEWLEAMREVSVHYDAPITCGIFLLALTYLTARRGDDDSALRRVLAWIGGLSILPIGAVLFLDRSLYRPGWEYMAAGWTIALGLPLLLAVLLRRFGSFWNFAAAAWTLIAYFFARTDFREQTFEYVWFALFAIAVIAWGVRERRVERINLGIAGFALVVLGFYYSSVMDKLGRSASLIGLGVLFLAGGLLLERTRRRLVARI